MGGTRERRGTSVAGRSSERVVILLLPDSDSDPDPDSEVGLELELEHDPWRSLVVAVPRQEEEFTVSMLGELPLA